MAVVKPLVAGGTVGAFFLAAVVVSGNYTRDNQRAICLQVQEIRQAIYTTNLKRITELQHDPYYRAHPALLRFNLDRARDNLRTFKPRSC